MTSRSTLLNFGLVLTLFLGPTLAHADTQENLVEEADSSASESLAAEGAAPGVRYGVGLRLRQVVVPKSIIELGVEESPGGVSHPGIGLDFVRRKGEGEWVIGIEYENLSPPDGYYVEKNREASNNGATDFVEFDGLSWVTLDATFLRHKKLVNKLYIRYGGGAGIALMLGDIRKTDSVCSSNETESCQRLTVSAEIDDPQDIPPVFFVLNLYGGLQYRVSPNLHLNIEAGFRTVMFAGVSGQYYF